MIDGIRVRSLKREASGVTDLPSFVRCERRTGRSAIRKAKGIQTRALGGEIAHLQNQSVGQLLLYRSIPSLRVGHPIKTVDRKSVGDGFAGRRDGETSRQGEHGGRAGDDRIAVGEGRLSR